MVQRERAPGDAQRIATALPVFMRGGLWLSGILSSKFGR